MYAFAALESAIESMQVRIIIALIAYFRGNLTQLGWNLVLGVIRKFLDCRRSVITTPVMHKYDIVERKGRKLHRTTSILLS